MNRGAMADGEPAHTDFIIFGERMRMGTLKNLELAVIYLRAHILRVSSAP